MRHSVTHGSTTPAKALPLQSADQAATFINCCFVFNGVNELAIARFFGYFLLGEKNGAALLSTLKNKQLRKT